MAVILYGLNNCDTCRKARHWLAAHGVAHEAVDLREQPVGADRLANWISASGWQVLLNRRSRTWRELPAAEREELDEETLPALLQRHPTLIKRPVLEMPGVVLVGFSEATYQATFIGTD